MRHMDDIILQHMRSIRRGIALCWLGNLSWLLSSQNRLIAFDLDLHLDCRIRTSPIPAEAIAPMLEVVFITHEHEDHFNSTTSGILANKSDCLFVVPANCEQKALEIGITEKRIHIARPGEAFDLPGIHVEPQRAIHGDKLFTVYRHANLKDCGYVFKFGGKTFLQPGDTVLLEEHLELTHVDVLFVSPTVHNTYIDRSTILINAIEPDYIFPQHFGTYIQNEENLFWTKGYPDELKAKLSRSMQAHYHKLNPGEVFVIE